MNTKVTFEREQIEVTRNGMFGGPVDVVRQFIPGPWTATVELEDGRTYDIPPEHHRALAALGTDDSAIAAFAVAHGVCRYE